MPPRLVNTYEPFDSIMVGDIVDWNGTPRKVRSVSRSEEDAVRYLVFAKLRSSWTGRPYVTYHRADIKKNFRGILIRGTSLCTNTLECQVQDAINHSRDPNYPYISEQDMLGAVR